MSAQNHVAGSSMAGRKLVVRSTILGLSVPFACEWVGEWTGCFFWKIPENACPFPKSSFDLCVCQVGSMSRVRFTKMTFDVQNKFRGSKAWACPLWFRTYYFQFLWTSESMAPGERRFEPFSSKDLLVVSMLMDGKALD